MSKPRVFAALAGSATVALGLAIGPAPGANAVPSAPVYGGNLHVAMPWPDVPDDFNPLSPGTSSATAGGTAGILYEPLMYDNPGTGRTTPLLATSYSWGAAGTSLTVSTRAGVEWSDGQPFSANDVAFTFNYIKRYRPLDTSGIWGQGLSSVTATGPGTVVFSFSRANVVALPLILGQLIVPQHIWDKVTNPVTYTNPAPVGTGPFLLKSRTKTEVVYKKNPHYWMAGRPYLGMVTMTAVKSVLQAEIDIFDGATACTDAEIVDPNESFVATDPSENHYWWPVTGLNLLYFNTTQAPFNDGSFRKAVAEALDANQVAQRAYYGAIPAAIGPVETGVLNGQVASWVPASLAPLEWSYNPAAAAATLAAAGYQQVNGSLESPSGQVLPTFKILVGAGWADYVSMAETIGQELAPLGIHTMIDQEPYGTYSAERDDAAYQLMISWENENGVSPYYAYHDLLDGDASTDWERYTSVADNDALSSFASTTDLAAQKSDMAEVEKDVLTNVPFVALTARTQFLDYTTKYFLGWPSPSNPYNDAEPPDGGPGFTGAGGAEMLYLNVHLSS